MPLAITLGERTLRDFASDLLIRAQDIAARIDDRAILDPAASDLQRRLMRSDPGGLERIIVVAAGRTLIADSDGPASLGEGSALGFPLDSTSRACAKLWREV